MTNQTFTISGMTCVACTKLTTKLINKINGVLDTHVDLESNTATVKANRLITPQEINTAFSDSSYRAEDNYK